jgi:hypothetical protein
MSSSLIGVKEDICVTVSHFPSFPGAKPYRRMKVIPKYIYDRFLIP